MLTYMQYLLMAAFLMEGTIYYWWDGREQVIVFETMDMQEVRLWIMLGSAFGLFMCELMKETADE